MDGNFEKKKSKLIKIHKILNKNLYIYIYNEVILLKI